MLYHYLLISETRSFSIPLVDVIILAGSKHNQEIVAASLATLDWGAEPTPLKSLSVVSSPSPSQVRTNSRKTPSSSSSSVSASPIHKYPAHSNRPCISSRTPVHAFDFGLLHAISRLASSNHSTYFIDTPLQDWHSVQKTRPVVSLVRLRPTMAYESANPDFATSRMSHSADYGHFDEQPQARPRGNSSVRSEDGMSDSTRYLRPQQPINEAVTSAFDKTETSIDPELIAQITQNVINQLKNTGIQDSNTPVPQNTRQFPPPVQPVPLSPSTMSASSPPTHTRNVYTPPSPHKQNDYQNRGSPPSQSAAYPVPPLSPQEKVTASFHDRRTSSPLSQTSDTSHHRPRGPVRLSTGKEETTLEKIWGQLFDEDCHPTARLGQFLRGLAVHIVRPQ